MTEKTLKLVPTKAGTYFRVQYEGGGEIPAELQGLWDVIEGKSAIQAYCLKKGKTQTKEIKVEMPVEPVAVKPTIQLDPLG